MKKIALAMILSASPALGGDDITDCRLIAHNEGVEEIRASICPKWSSGRIEA
jgi:hypothetical protein